MRLLDANILMYASFDVYPQHVRTKTWLDERLNDPDVPLGIPWESALAFVRLASNPRVRTPALRVSEAWRQVRNWLSAQSVWIPLPTPRHRNVLDELLARPGMNSKLVADAHLAALAIEHGLVLCSADTDFALFPHLRFENPTI
jgi:toxin-antitoxin system PIN domain toxin